jgi:formate/nitrite transporter FocA (FNT family)
MVSDFLSECSEFCANIAGRLTVLFFTTSQGNDIGEQVCVELFHSLMEHCRLTSLDIFLEGLLVCFFVSNARTLLLPPCFY